jgi:hypothetical protein
MQASEAHHGDPAKGNVILCPSTHALAKLTAKHYLTDALSAKQGEKAYAHWAVS